jgi:hypothetical protein
MNRPTSKHSHGPLASRIGIRRSERCPDETAPMTIRLQGRAAWFRLFPTDGDAAQPGPKGHQAESAESTARPSPLRVTGPAVGRSNSAEPARW